MPIYKEWETPGDGLAAIWKMEEPESFFREKTGLEPAIKNEKRRIEHIAGRFLLQYLETGFPIGHINKDEHNKPRISNNEYFFSISHSWPYVAAIIDPDNETGIDIQTFHPHIRRIQHKFLSPAEQEIFQNDPQLLTAAWTAKEAAYKWHGKKGISFMEHLPITYFGRSEEEHSMSIYFNLTKIPKMILIKNILTTDFACSYIVSSDDWVIY